MSDQIDYISGQSECLYEVENPEVVTPEVDNPEIDNPEVDNPVFVSPYQCNMTGMCKVSHKHRVQNHNINAQTSWSAFCKGVP